MVIKFINLYKVFCMIKKVPHKLLFSICMVMMMTHMTIGLSHNDDVNSEFVVKKKTKKESVSSLKEDIAGQLELSLRQMSKNIAEQAKVQQQIFDKIKDLLGACESEKSVFAGSAEQLKAQRDKLQTFHKKLVQQQDDLQTFLGCF